MRRRIIGSSCAAALLAFAVAATGQTAPQSPSQSPVKGDTSQSSPTSQRSTASARTSTTQDVTLTGCVMRAPASSSASAGSNEFVLSNATASTETAHPSAPGNEPSSIPSPSPSTSARTGSTTTGISGQGAGMSYALEGTQASNLAKYVGQRVEVVGQVEGGAIGTSGTASGSPGATASTNDAHEGAQAKAGTTSGGQASASATVGTTGTRMPRVTVTSVRPMSGSCL